MPFNFENFHNFICYRDSSWITLIITYNEPNNGRLLQIEELTIEEMAQELGN